MKERVVLLKSGDESDPYEKALIADGFEVTTVPVLTFRQVNGEALRAALEHPDHYGGLVLTSPRAVDALGEAMPWLPSENVRWHLKPIYAVGPRTADMLRDIGFEPAGEGSGSAELLADYILAHRPDGPLLFLCGNRRREVLPDVLARAGVQIEELVVYESAPCEVIGWPKSPVDWVVFFSPSGLDAIRDHDFFKLGTFRIACIGPTTADALHAAGLTVAAVAAEPSPDALALAIRRSGGRT